MAGERLIILFFVSLFIIQQLAFKPVKSHPVNEFT